MKLQAVTAVKVWLITCVGITIVPLHAKSARLFPNKEVMGLLISLTTD